MPPESSSDLPSDPSELARLIADMSQPDGTRNRAIQRLLPTIAAVARRAVGSWGSRGQLAEDLRAEAPTLVWERIDRFDPRLGRFEDWCLTVLCNCAIDRWRKTKPERIMLRTGGEQFDAAVRAAIAAPEQPSEDFMERCRELRAVLDQIAWPPSRTVHHFAVLLLQLRLVAARHLTGQELSQDASWRAELPQYVEWLLPWHPGEHQARLKPGWPPLETLWAAICRTIRDPAVKIEAEAVCGSIAPLLSPAAQLTPDVWNHWVHRAKEQARARARDEGVWTRCFSRLLPDHTRGGG